MEGKIPIDVGKGASRAERNFEAEMGECQEGELRCCGGGGRDAHLTAGGERPACKTWTAI